MTNPYFEHLRANKDRVSGGQYNKAVDMLASNRDTLQRYGFSDSTGHITRPAPPTAVTERMVYRARATEAAGATDHITCNLIEADGTEVDSGEFGYEIEIYFDISGGSALNEALPRLADDEYIQCFQSYHTDATLRWYGIPPWQASIDCECDSADLIATAAPDAAEGAMWFDTATKELKIYDGAAWKAVELGGHDIATVAAGNLSITGQELDITTTPEFANLGIGVAAAASKGIYLSKTIASQNIVAGIDVDITSSDDTTPIVSVSGLDFLAEWEPASPAGALTCISGYGVKGIVTATNNSAQDITMTSAYGVAAQIKSDENSTGITTITSAYNFYAYDGLSSGGGLLTTLYGLYVADMTAGGTNYAIYTAGANSDTYLEGDISAEDVTDRTPDWGGTSQEALQAVLNIKGKDGKLDHDSLPAFARRSFIEQRPTGEKIIEIMGNDEIEVDVREPIEVSGRSLGAMITLLTEAVKEQQIQIELLKAA